MKHLFILTILIGIITGCKPTKKQHPNSLLNVVTTITMITDLVQEIGGEFIQLNSLMGSGVDPHLYKASEGDVTKLANADIIFYNGLHLEGKLVEVFKKMKHQNIHTVAVAKALQKDKLIQSKDFQSNFDPHIWFNIQHWKLITQHITKHLIKLKPQYAKVFLKNSKTYLQKLSALETEIQQLISQLPIEKRILVTAHDAFNYFGEEFNFQVVGLQGLSTATEAGVKDVQNTAAFIIDNKIKAIFVESSVPKQTIKALQAAVQSKNHNVSIGGTLYSDALGNSGTPEGTYIGMYKYNVKTIVNALK